MVLVGSKFTYPLVSGSYIGKILALKNIVREQKMMRRTARKRAQFWLVSGNKFLSIYQPNYLMEKL